MRLQPYNCNRLGTWWIHFLFLHFFSLFLHESQKLRILWQSCSNHANWWRHPRAASATLLALHNLVRIWGYDSSATLVAPFTCVFCRVLSCSVEPLRREGLYICSHWSCSAYFWRDQLLLIGCGQSLSDAFGLMFIGLFVYFIWLTNPWTRYVCLSVCLSVFLCACVCACQFSPARARTQTRTHTKKGFIHLSL